MNTTPKWYLPVVILALLWNMAGCAAYLKDVMLTPEDVAKLSVEMQALGRAGPDRVAGRRRGPGPVPVRGQR